MENSMVGRVLGHYELIELIGKGGMARVYKSIQPVLDRHVAVKLLHPSVAADEEFLERFRREAKAAASLRHPHIVQIFDFGHQAERYYMVMELIDGPTLREELQKLEALDETLPFGKVQRIIREVSEALDYAHDRGIIHRDVKPANILFTPEGQAVLSDFGLAFIVEGPRQTITGFVGTPEYMSPEQGLGLAVDGRTDVYSLGVVLYEMLTCRVPFTSKTPMAIVMKHINEPLPPPRSLNPDIPESVEQVLFKAMSKEPDDRYSQAGELSRALAEAFEAAAVVEAPTAIPVISEEIPEVLEEPEEGPRCAMCGATVSLDMSFCGACGAPLGERWQTPILTPPVVLQLPTTAPKPLVTTEGERRSERSKLPLMIAILGTGLLTVIVLAVIVAMSTGKWRGLSTDEPTVAGGVGGTVVFIASDTPSPTFVPTEAQPTVTVTVVSTPTASAIASPTPTEAKSTLTPTLTEPAPTATPTFTPTEPAPTATPTFTPTEPAPMATPTLTTEPTVEPTKIPVITSYENKIVFWSDREGGKALYVMNPDGSDQRKLDDESVYYNALALEAISPDGKWVLKVRSIDGNDDIWKVDVARTQDDRITSNAEIDQEPVWSPVDPNRIAFVSTRAGNTDIWTQNISEPLDEKQLTDNPDYDKHPSWSPYGTQIVYWTVHQGGSRQIWVMDTDGSNKRNLSNNDYSDWDPIWVKQP